MGEIERELFEIEKAAYVGQIRRLREENERLHKAIDRVGFYCAGTEFNHVSKFVLRIK
ncbi:hypothetical protein [Paenibacillus radicis (ex Xue et al. 2023)]|uniref:Transposase n=1 Tax=Paenibacillus radicis (ex Xue et al. 2023) TaxID=2972489 RepID=A0ABT1Y903_9BACL|nr:hypothetical protein [Paenibacillus radicis (ex Xue et al. 2023)]MCR8629672.1 hypothetical protein [Paenibacillus radicis (ex Xue et al. 2023)]